MKMITPPNEFKGTKKTIFLAGGIQNCEDWQSRFASYLEKTSWTLLNPRRPNFPMDDPTAAEKQIQWEFDHLRKADHIIFWFPKETLCPIVLYELGAWSAHPLSSIMIGIHPDYQRKQDVEIQTKLVRPEVNIFYTLEDLANGVLSQWGK